MADGIFLLEEGGVLVEMVQQQYDSERMLQALLARYPGLLAGEEIGAPGARRWLLVAREAALTAEAGGRWAVDHLFVDQEGVPTLVEVKRSADSRLRREMVGQVLDYAAYAVRHWPPGTLYEQFRAQCRRERTDPQQRLARFLGPAGDSLSFWQRVHDNLRAGRIRIALVADAIPAELGNVVGFLGSQMRPAEVVAIEVRQYVGAGLKTLVPRLVGASRGPRPAAGAGPTLRPAGREGAEPFLATLRETCGEGEARAARALLDWAQTQTGGVAWTQGAGGLTFRPVVRRKQETRYLPAVTSTGRVQVPFRRYAQQPPFAAPNLRLELLNQLNALRGVSLPATAIGGRPTFPLTALVEDGEREAFLDVLAWMVEQIRLP